MKASEMVIHNLKTSIKSWFSGNPQKDEKTDEFEQFEKEKEALVPKRIVYYIEKKHY